MSTPALALEGLTRTFTRRRSAPRTALDAIDLVLPAGGVHGLLGPNGAGKTTLCRTVSTVLLPSAGRAAVLGHDVVADAAWVRREIGIVFGGDRGLYERLTAEENLHFWSAMHGLRGRAARRRSAELLERLGLAGRARERVETFSRGMKQRLHLARGLVADPSVLLLDEPTVGMDPVSAHDFRGLIGQLRSEGRTILLTTHDMAEAEAVCDTVTFVDRGRIVGAGTPSDVRRLLERGQRIRVYGIDASALAVLEEALVGAAPEDAVSLEYEEGAGSVLLTVTGGEETVAQVLMAIVQAGHTAITAAPLSLEEVYLGLLGAGDRGMQL
ncbi:ABC transporter ATP-binding protein [Bogoriella caseilytica]|uniref:ABC-2 type transport system ATP-binding protein n=1 Tax=Bogoriella caseilytica TaxID=56055 RepID=A0A3N2BDD0_9MICO|nr:ABC transporter ATP-binding protein [Bogoriella caseilytica]ROR73235.1 ABC-2 type transport system ATP-binding protein [Bogoriella caseilytica]